MIKCRLRGQREELERHVTYFQDNLDIVIIKPPSFSKDRGKSGLYRVYFEYELLQCTAV